MKKNIIIAAISAASAILLAASCQKQTEPELIGEGKTFTAVIEQGLTKTTITSEYKVNWEAGDQIDINGTTFSATPDATDATKASFTKVSGSDPIGEYGYTAVYPASIMVESQPTLPATQTYAAGKFNAPMCAMSDTETLEFKNFCGVLCFALKGTDKVRSIVVTANEQICGPFDFADATVICFSGENEGYTVTLDCGTEGIQLNEATATNFYIYLPQATYTAGMKMTITNTNGKTFEKTTTKSVKIERSNIYTFNWTPSFASVIPAGALPGVFSVSNDGGTTIKQVRFSQGNLYAKNEGTTESPDWKWHFYDEQYKYNSLSTSSLRMANANDTEIDLFTWGYNAEKSIIPNGITSDNVSRTAGDLIQTEDWGSQIGDSSTWRTLTNEEWQYLFNTRTDASNKVGFATVNDVHGIIILPDTFTDPMKNNGSVAFEPKSTTGWTANVYTIGGNWEAMETAGAVFLPAAGRRYGSIVYDVGDYGYYWSSTANDENYAYYVFFNSYYVYPGDSDDRDYGFSVRLITESK